MKLKTFILGLFLAAASFVFLSQPSLAFTASKVWFEFRANGTYRVHVNYTIPALKEFREAFVDFKSKKKAEAYYWDLVRGADFYLSDPENRKFKNRAPEPSVW